MNLIAYISPVNDRALIKASPPPTTNSGVLLCLSPSIIYILILLIIIVMGPDFLKKFKENSLRLIAYIFSVIFILQVDYVNTARNQVRHFSLIMLFQLSFIKCMFKPHKIHPLLQWL